MLTKKLFSILLVSIFTVSLVGCGNTNDVKKETTSTPYTGTLKGALKDYTYKIGTSGTYAPFSYFDSNGKNIVGFDMDLLHELQNVLGFKIQTGNVQSMDYGPLTTSLAVGKLDISIAAICATDTRKKGMDFTDTYYNAGLSVIVNKKTSPKEIIGIDSLKSGKYKIAVQKGDASHLFLTGANVPASSIQVHDSITTALQSLEQGKVDAMVYDAPGTKFYIKNKKDSNLKMIGDQFAKEQTPYAIAISFDASKKNPKLLSIMNAAVKKLKDDGTMAKLEKKWLK
ncbi:transporter substrate-binding domain-containing protein [Clostridium frigoris]|uniref:Transporter substrate-binding domain-containing protein n=1 Tax=Clostridium frigoris TaxID=205327 RepID=A0ABS6BWE9_9CLOT|nr:transporter substrate-binding domain-containing protein [Clostridium frigoris]MBU3160814.1 transporter substrate-binding domain-containing protein [Clostridium frigoris]